eukprot:TRINITY_DN7005_c0_g1_i7.p1 TRINITY_DN7005_c0_g1~~TRINITY_DN7005_c0_g1_i7.p1  ORF type:complete len:409 (-),score=68.63 TRINITY_DN7005_c0_g1_i7:61-1287(-)
MPEASKPAAGKEVVSILPSIAFSDLKNHKFDEIIDVRTPLEFAEDHVQGAINLPVLSNEERAQVGTLYASDKLKGRKIGAALIARNISDHIMNHFQDKELDYKPLIYCWRGGQRSRSMATILKEIGFQPSLLQAGYKQYRKTICNYLCTEENEKDGETNLERIKLVRISGATGSGKTLLLKALEERGEQILDLEYLAKHKGSILGDYPDAGQPSQKFFETELYNQLEALKTDKVVWVENEGSKIGNLNVSRRLFERMSSSPRVHITVDMDDRVDYILKDYEYLISNPDLKLPDLLKRIEKYAGKKTCDAWLKLLGEKNYRELVVGLIKYYDSSYKVPKGESLATLAMPSGLLLDFPKLTSSQYVDNFISIGDEYLKNIKEGADKEDCLTKNSDDFKELSENVASVEIR